MEHAEEADLRAQVPRITCDFKQGGGACAEQQAVDQPLVLERHRCQFTRQCEDGMDIARRQQLPLALLEPAGASVALALRAVPVTARVIGDGSMAAAGAAIAMATERSGTATRDRSEHLLMLSVDPPATAVDEALSCIANDVSHLQWRPVYALR
jgi:hypothetical protein